jgi:hypothetical protein
MLQFRDWIEPWPENLSGSGDEEFARDTASAYIANSKIMKKNMPLRMHRYSRKWYKSRLYIGKPIVKPS